MSAQNKQPRYRQSLGNRSASASPQIQNNLVHTLLFRVFQARFHFVGTSCFQRGQAQRQNVRIVFLAHDFCRSNLFANQVHLFRTVLSPSDPTHFHPPSPPPSQHV